MMWMIHNRSFLSTMSLFAMLMHTQEGYITPSLVFGKSRASSSSSSLMINNNGWAAATNSIRSNNRMHYYYYKTTSTGKEAALANNNNENNEDDPLTKEELQYAVDLYRNLPRDIQNVLRRAVTKSYNNKLNDLEPVNDTDVVIRLYMKRTNLIKFPSTWVRPRIKAAASLASDSTSTNENTTYMGGSWGSFESTLDKDKYMSDQLKDFIQSSGASITKTELERFVESFFPPVTRKGEGYEPTEVDASDIMTYVLGKDTFNPKSKPEKIPGGYVIRGSSRFNTGDELINALDKRFELYCTSSSLANASANTLEIEEEVRRRTSLRDRVQICYCKDPTPEAMEDMSELFGESVLVLLCKDFSPKSSNYFVSIATSILAIAASFLFSIGCFSSTETVADRMRDIAASVGDHDLGWFNSLFLPLIGSIALIQLAHELGHLLAASQGKFKSTVTTLLPAVSLPTFGAITSITTSPKNFQSLFDFALVGPICGIVASLALLYVGLENTLNMDAETFKYLPSLSVQYIKSSALAGGIIDATMGGGLLQSPANAAESLKISLDPFAIAGFCGLIANALNLLPLGNTDGGRIATTLFGRNGFLLIQGLTLVFLASAGLFGNDPNHIFVSYSLFAVITQKSLEVPMRNEIDSLDIPRGLLAIAVWVLTALILLPAS